MPHSMCSCQNTTYRTCRKRCLNLLSALSPKLARQRWLLSPRKTRRPPDGLPQAPRPDRPAVAQDDDPQKRHALLGFRAPFEPRLRPHRARPRLPAPKHGKARPKGHNRSHVPVAAIQFAPTLRPRAGVFGKSTRAAGNGGSPHRRCPGSLA